MEEALYERNMIQFFRKKPSSLILKLVIEDTSWHAYHNPNPKKKIIAQVDYEVSRRAKKESDGPWCSISHQGLRWFLLSDYSPRFEIIVLPVRDHSVSSYFKPFSYVPELNSVLKAQNPEPL